MAYTTINKSSDYFNTITTTGGAKSVTGVGFQPDWVWNKRRDSTSDHHINDAVRGSSKLLYTNATTAEQTNANFLTSFDSDGFTTGSGYWSSSANIVAWNWKANGTGSANTDGSINSTVSVNTTAGFSIVSFTGNSTSGATVGHGLGVAPKMIILKLLSGSDNWTIYHSSLGNTKRLELNNTNTPSTSATAGWNNTSPTTSVFSLGNNGQVNGSGQTYIAYCFAEKQGYSKFGSYVGNGNADGTFVYLGFKPAFFITKNTTTGSSSWMLYDNKRDPDNQMAEYLYPNTNAAAGTSSSGFDFLSNGIKIRNTFGDANVNGNTFIYMAFAEAPLVGTNNIPATAR